MLTLYKLPILFVLLNLVDCLLTLTAIQFLGASELNPLATALGLIPYLVVKMIGAILVAIGMILFRMKTSLRILTIGMAVICTWNLTMILIGVSL